MTRAIAGNSAHKIRNDKRNMAKGESSTTKNTDLKNLFGYKDAGRESSLSLKMEKDVT